MLKTEIFYLNLSFRICGILESGATVQNYSQALCLPATEEGATVQKLFSAFAIPRNGLSTPLPLDKLSAVRSRTIRGYRLSKKLN